ncbi:MAG: MBL fold metallo-hydrolase [Sulfolobaceae archaeon]
MPFQYISSVLFRDSSLFNLLGFIVKQIRTIDYIESMINIKRFELGDYFTNTYVVSKSSYAILIDAGDKPYEVINYIRDKGLELKAILATHGHFDHLMGVPEIKKVFNVPLYLHIADEELVKRDHRTREVQIDYYLKEGDLIFGDIRVKVIETPGHTMGSVCFLIENSLFTGDTLFNENIGRYDLGGDKELLKRSLKRLIELDDLLDVYPGHGFITTLGYEKLHNPFLNGEINW